MIGSTKYHEGEQTEEDEMGGTRSMRGIEDRNAYKILARKLGGKRPLARPMRRDGTVILK